VASKKIYAAHEESEAGTTPETTCPKVLDVDLAQRFAVFWTVGAIHCSVVGMMARVKTRLVFVMALLGLLASACSVLGLEGGSSGEMADPEEEFTYDGSELFDLYTGLCAWVTPEQFAMYREEGLKRGFKVVESGPLVRSSYHADHQADTLTPILEQRRRSERAH
jgi:hypothetical protein